MSEDLLRVQNLIALGKEIATKTYIVAPDSFTRITAIDSESFFDWQTEVLSFLTDAFGKDSVYYQQFEKLCKRNTLDEVAYGQGVLEAARKEVVRRLGRGESPDRSLFHIRIAQKYGAAFERGEYDSAIRGAFVELEDTVRTKAGLPATQVGAALVRGAFNPAGGPLTDQYMPPPEQEGLMHLFAGAFLYRRNRYGHRNISVTDPSEAAGVMILVSHLLRIVDTR